MLVTPSDGRVADLGVVQMRVLAAGKENTQGNFTLAEFTGGPRPWTVPHVHQAMEESFFVLDGTFTFTFGHEPLTVDTGSYLLIPRGIRHSIQAGEGGGRLLTLMVPGGLEEMFYELAELAPGALTDPQVRAAISAKYDSVPSAS